MQKADNLELPAFSAKEQTKNALIQHAVLFHGISYALDDFLLARA